MKTGFGGWMPISRNLAQYLPNDRPFTELEAMYSLQLDYTNGRKASISGYSKLWCWSRKRVKTFLDKVLADIVSIGKSPTGGEIISTLPEGGEEGASRVTSRVTSKGQVRLIKINDLHTGGVQVGSKQGYKKGSTTIEREIEIEKKTTKAKSVPEDEFSDLY